VGDLICGFVNTSLAATTRCGFGLRSPAANAEVYPETIQGDGVILHPEVLPSAAALPACNGDTVAATVPNYPFVCDVRDSRRRAWFRRQVQRLNPLRF
jgi:hypothetical protein